MSDRAADAGAATIPRTEREIAAAAADLGIDIPDACMAGVVANLGVLDGHARTMLASGVEPS